jgi:hypothetical protein
MAGFIKDGYKRQEIELWQSRSKEKGDDIRGLF